MPVRLNLLAEAQAAEEARRKDPVKRAIYFGILAVFLVFAFWGYLWLQTMNYESDLATHKKRYESIEKSFKELGLNQSQISAIEGKLLDLNRFATNRVLLAPMLDALQEVVVDNVEVTSIRTEQSFQVDPGVQGKDPKLRRPASSTQIVLLKIEARDYNITASSHQEYRKQLIQHPYFVKALKSDTDDLSVGIFLRGAARRPTESDEAGNQYRRFSLECVFPKVIRY